MPQWLVIGISGVTCGGKTSLAQALREYFNAQRNSQLWNTPYILGDVQLISQDDYFLPVDDLRHKWNDKLNAINFELLTALDMKQMLSDITWTMKGRYLASDPIDYINEMTMSTGYEHYGVNGVVPRHHYSTNLYNQHAHQHLQQQQQQWQRHHHSSIAAATATVASSASQHPNASSNIMRVNSHAAVALRDNKVNILLVEGFMIFNQPELLTLCNLKFHFHLPYEKCFQRRRQRCYDPPDVTGYFEICVWPHYEKNFAEFRERKDITFLNGEISKERIFQFVVSKIIAYFEERCDVASCPPPHKLLGMHATVSAAAGGGGSCNVSGSGNMSMGGSNISVVASGCPMEQQ